MHDSEHLLIKDFFYHLPQESIAQFPVAKRDESRLLIYQDKEITQSLFKNIPDYIPSESLLIFNDTKVIHARLLFRKNTGAEIEIFCLEPVDSNQDLQLAFQQKNNCRWKCLVGNSKKWKEGILINKFSSTKGTIELKAERCETQKEFSVINFSWEPAGLSFVEVLEKAGVMPLPPYINREAELSDDIQYQTIYAQNEGSVAAPTAGLHFTDAVMQKLVEKNIQKEYVSLHVGAGTFKPVSTEDIADHVMHTERIIVKTSTIKKLIETDKEKIIAVGTTSVRTLESLYWMGVKLIRQKNNNKFFHIGQWDAYEESDLDVPVNESLQILYDYLITNKLDVLRASTQLLIKPGYKFRLVNGIITNFHQPQSTLLLLISAFIGSDWRRIYDFALDHHFRFLSFGDCCLFL
jgi:S-adenosylmethionine:tRNA ribosyltransferase-isomerase